MSDDAMTADEARDCFRSLAGGIRYPAFVGLTRHDDGEVQFWTCTIKDAETGDTCGDAMLYEHWPEPGWV